MLERIEQLQDDINELWEVAASIPLRIGADGAGGAPTSSIGTPGFGNEITCFSNTCIEKGVISESCGNCSEIPLGYQVSFGNTFPRDSDDPSMVDTDASSDNCCFELGGIHVLQHTGGCRWQTNFFDCGIYGSVAWELSFQPPFIDLKLTLDSQNKVLYRANVDDWCCLCRNGMTLVCNNLPWDCGGFSCFVCVTPFCGCQYSFVAELNWDYDAISDPPTLPDLDLYTRVVTADPVAVVYFGNGSGGGVGLNHDAFPACNGPTPPEFISGSFSTSQTFETWWNQHSDCTEAASPTKALATIKNTGLFNISVNSQVVRPGDEWTQPVEGSGGFDIGAEPDYVPSEQIEVICPC